MCFLLIDRLAARWFTAPVVGVILILGQLGDATVLYVTVPAIVLVSLFRVIQTRQLRTGDAALLLAAIASVPLEMLLRKGMLNAGAYLEVAPRTKLAPSSLLGVNYHYTLAVTPAAVRRADRAFWRAGPGRVRSLDTWR